MSVKVLASFRYPNNQRFTSLPSSWSSKSHFLVVTCPHGSALGWRVLPQLTSHGVAPCSSTSTCKRWGWSFRGSADGNGLNSPANGIDGRTRLSRAIRTLQVKLNARIQEIKSGFFMKVLFFFVGFYCATAFSTVIGQTGDWDILSAGLAVIVVEGIGALMYKSSFPFLNSIKSLTSMFNYWKVGLSLGLFLDAFKY